MYGLSESQVPEYDWEACGNALTVVTANRESRLSFYFFLK